MLKRAVARKPADPALRGSYANALMRDNDPAAAERQLLRALKLSPEHPDLMTQHATCLSRLGRDDEAKRTFETLLERYPGRPPVVLGYAELLIQLGETERARSIFQSTLEQGLNPAQALAGLVKCQTFQGNPPELAEIRALLGKPGLKPAEAISLSLAAAKICNDIGAYDEEFEHCLAAKSVLGSDYDGAFFSRRYELMRSIFTPEFFTKRKGYGNPSPKAGVHRGYAPLGDHAGRADHRQPSEGGRRRGDRSPSEDRQLARLQVA